MGEEKQPVRRVSKKARKRTRILIAYDGSSCARSALEDLSRAGLPQEVDALVVSVSEVWLPPPSRNELAGKVFVEDIPSIPRSAATGAPASLATEAVEASRLVRDILHDIEPTFSSLRVQSEPATPTNVVESREGARLMPSGLSGADSGIDGEIRTNQTKHLEELASQAYEAADILRSSFPDWDVQVQTCHGSPATALLEKADEWHPDLIVVGSHGRSAIGRLFLGSVSHKIAMEAKCSVRIARDLAREPRTSAARILIAVDGSPGSTAAVQAVGARVWPTGSEARLVAVYDSVTPTMAGNFIPPVMQWVEDENKLSIKRAREMVV